MLKVSKAELSILRSMPREFCYHPEKERKLDRKFSGSHLSSHFLPISLAVLGHPLNLSQEETKDGTASEGNEFSIVRDSQEPLTKDTVKITSVLYLGVRAGGKISNC